MICSKLHPRNILIKSLLLRIPDAEEHKFCKMTYTAYSGDGHRAGDETKAFVHAHIQGSRPTITHTLLQRIIWFGENQRLFSILDLMENDLRSFFSKYRRRTQEVCVLHYQWLHHWKVHVEEWKKVFKAWIEQD